jgi:hypothetical protein
MATRAEIAMSIRENYPDIPDDSLNKAVTYFQNNADAFKQFKKSGALPAGAMTRLGGGVVSPAKVGAKAGASAVKGLVKTLKPKSKKGALKGAAALAAGGLAINMFDGGEDIPATTESQANANMMNALAIASASGVDINALAGTAMGQQILGTNPQFDISSFTNSANITPLTGGVYVPGGVTVSSRPPDFAGGQPVETRSETIPLNQWKNQFPISDPKALADWRAKLVAAGVVSASAGLQELKSQWEAWGEYSQESMRQGQKLSPYQLLDIQRGLWGGGGGDTGPSYSTQLIKKANSRDLLKQYLEAGSGRVIDDAEADEFANLIRKKQLKKPTKTEVKTVKGKKMTVTTPGFGEAEAADIAEKRAMQDPLYAEFQTANVFGSALEKALGVRP